MSFNYIPISTDSSLEELIRKFNETFQELSQYLNEREVVLFDEAPRAPFNGMLAYATGVNWDPGGGKGLYAYQNGRYIKLGATRIFPRFTQFKNITTGHAVGAGDIDTDKPYILRSFLNLNPVNVTCTYTGTTGDIVGFFNLGGDVMNIAYGTGRNATLQIGEGLCLYYSALGWGLLQ